MANYSYVVMEYRRPQFYIAPYKVFLDENKALEFVEKHNEWYKEMCMSEGIDYDSRMELWVDEIQLINQ